MKINNSINSIQENGFSLVELLLVLGIISIMASIVISSFTNAAQDSRNVVSRQQQATLQSALNNWVAGQVGGFERPDPLNPSLVFHRSIAYVRNKYNYADNYWTESPSSSRASRSTLGKIGRLELISKYLDADSYQHFVQSSEGEYPDIILSQAMKKTGQYLTLSDWDQSQSAQAVNYPKVKLFP